MVRDRGQLKSWSKWEANPSAVSLWVNGFYQGPISRAQPVFPTVDFKSLCCFVLAPHRRFTITTVFPHRWFTITLLSPTIWTAKKQKWKFWKVNLPTVVKVRLQNTWYLEYGYIYTHVQDSFIHPNEQFFVSPVKSF
jgi:hypothetical protein